MVSNDTDGDGINAWRRLVNKYDPRTMNHAVGFQKKAVKLGRAKSADPILPVITELYDLVRKYTSDRGDEVTFDEATGVCILY